MNTTSFNISDSIVDQFIQSNYPMQKSNSAFKRVAPVAFKNQVKAFLVKKQQKDILSQLGELIEYTQLVTILGDDQRIQIVRHQIRRAI